jgi:hypothetical protein
MTAVDIVLTKAVGIKDVEIVGELGYMLVCQV